MKVAVITVLDNTNFGTYLQAIATAITIKKMGHDPLVIRYTRPFMTYKGYSMLILREKGFFRWFNRCILHSIKPIFNLRENNYGFLAKFTNVSREYVGFDELLQDPPVADVYMTGSDQVWNSIYNRGIDRSYYLDFAPNGYKRVSYASSIGMSSIPQDQADEAVALLRKYNNITVRETSAYDLLNSFNIKTQVVLDPTLLLDKEEWSAIVKETSFEITDKFLLTYSVEYGEEESYIEYYAKIIAKERGLKIYHVSYSSASFMPKYADRCFSLATPNIFLYLMFHASFAVVSSFHGTAFAVNFNKQFITISPKRFNTRIDSLLNTTGLSNRCAIGLNLQTSELKDINYNEVNIKLFNERMQSISIMRQLIEN